MSAEKIADAMERDGLERPKPESTVFKFDGLSGVVAYIALGNKPNAEALPDPFFPQNNTVYVLTGADKGQLARLLYLLAIVTYLHAGIGLAIAGELINRPMTTLIVNLPTARYL